MTISPTKRGCKNCNYEELNDYNMTCILCGNPIVPLTKDPVIDDHDDDIDETDRLAAARESAYEDDRDRRAEQGF